MKILSLAKTLAILLCLGFSLGACVQFKPVPGYARAGDYIIIGLGGVHRNAGGEPALSKDDLTITITDANTMTYDLEARYVFRSYLDYNALMHVGAIDGTSTQMGLTGIVPFDGGWFAAVPLTYAGQYESPLVELATGAAQLKVSSPKLSNTADGPEGNLDNIPIEILPGVSQQDDQYVAQFFSYSANGHNFVISPDNLGGASDIAGAFMVVDYNDETFFKNGLMPMVVPVHHNPYAQLSYHVKDNGNGTGSVYITLLNPAGFKASTTSTVNASLHDDLAVRLVYFTAGTIAQAKGIFSLDSAKSYYIDGNGAVIGGISPTLVHAADL